MFRYRHHSLPSLSLIGRNALATCFTLAPIALVSLCAVVMSGCGSGALAVPAPVSQPSTAPVSTTAIVIQPFLPTVVAGGTDSVSIVQGTPVAGATWVVLGGTANGTIDVSGMYHAPQSVPTPNAISVGYSIPGGQTFTATISVISAAPAISSVLPSTLTSLSTPVTITGTGFVAGAMVVIDGAPVPTTYMDAFHLSATIVLPAPVPTTHQVSIANPDNTVSALVSLPAVFPMISVQPALLTSGPVQLTVTGAGFDNTSVVTMNGTPLATTVVSSTSLSATGYLAPWQSDDATIEVTSQGLVPADGSSPGSVTAAASVPVAKTLVPYDAAARFTTQAAFGPRPGLVEHIQKVGFDAFITEQFQQGPVQMSYENARYDYINAAAQGSSVLRQRVAYALGTVFVQQYRDFEPGSIYIEGKLETGATGNFRQLLSDVTGDANIGYLLNLAGNFASGNPNQNFARELMQLFTIGPFLLNDDGSQQLDAYGSPIPSYDQDTVVAVTRALTGWCYPTPVNLQATAWDVDYSQPLYGWEGGHDHGAKTLFGTTLPAGSTITSDRDAVLNILFQHPNVPPFIAFRLIQHLVTSNPSPAYIKRVASVFKDNGSGVRGDMSAVVRAILLDPEARKGDTAGSPDDGFLQDPLLFQLFAMNILQTYGSDHETITFTSPLAEPLWNVPNVFGFVSPTHLLPGTSLYSPEYALFNNISLADRSSMLWGVITETYSGYTNDYVSGSWLMNRFKTVPSMIEALNHMAYHGTMSAQQKNIISVAASQSSSDPTVQRWSAMFLALNADSYNVVH